MAYANEGIYVVTIANIWSKKRIAYMMKLRNEFWKEIEPTFHCKMCSDVSLLVELQK